MKNKLIFTIILLACVKFKFLYKTFISLVILFIIGLKSYTAEPLFYQYFYHCFSSNKNCYFCNFLLLKVTPPSPLQQRWTPFFESFWRTLDGHYYHLTHEPKIHDDEGSLSKSWVVALITCLNLSIITHNVQYGKRMFQN